MDITGSIQGALNQANQASRLAEAEKAKARKTELDRLRDARRQYIATQEEVAESQALRGARAAGDREQSDGQDARDQYEGHHLLSDDPAAATPRRTPPKALPKGDARPPAVPPDQAGSGQLIDLEA